MEIINKKHKDIYQRNAQASPTVSIAKEKMTFQASTVEMCKMLIGDYVHFILDGNCWCFIVNKDDSGFKIYHPDIKRSLSSVSISSTPLLRKFMDCTGAKSKDKFYVRRTDTELNRQPVFEIMTHKPISKMGK